MKQLRKKIEKTDLEQIEAYKAINTNSSVSAKECVGKEFQCQGYVIYESTIIETDDETGEVIGDTVGKNIILVTSIGFIGSNSKTIIGSFEDMIADLTEEVVYNLPLHITSGKAKSGNTFYDIELV